ncbi:hypothetical protein FJ208_02345 [Candidatus Gribaldobacteria bacterium]|nr:hypothetical protein [Candidatus Gribaldobacteria bacterium]
MKNEKLRKNSSKITGKDYLLILEKTRGSWDVSRSEEEVKRKFELKEARERRAENW